MKKINIAVLGLGNVGQGLINTLNLNINKIRTVSQRELTVRQILVRNVDKYIQAGYEREILTDDIEEIFRTDLDIVVELMGGLHPAYEYIKRALENGISVVTANKAVIATYGEELRSLAQKNKVHLRYEASVGGGIPIVNTLRENLISNEIDEMVGIINGTTNYILTQMEELDMSFEDALDLAREKGFAEADSSSDIEGYDCAYKLSILSSIAYGLEIKLDDIPREGIQNVSIEDIKYARELGYSIKLLASVHNNKGLLDLAVNPALITKNHPLANIRNEFNAVLVKGNSLGEIMLYGKGAGSMPTGSAVLSDVISISLYDSEDNINKYSDSGYKINNTGLKKYYLRLDVRDQAGVLSNISKVFGDLDISIDSMVQRARGNETVPLVFITHETKRDLLDRAVLEIRNIDAVLDVASIMSVEGV